MKTLDFESRTLVARDSIRLVCTAAGVTLRERRKVNKYIYIYFVFPNEFLLLISLKKHQLIIQ